MPDDKYCLDEKTDVYSPSIRKGNAVLFYLATSGHGCRAENIRTAERVVRFLNGEPEALQKPDVKVFTPHAELRREDYKTR